MFLWICGNAVVTGMIELTSGVKAISILSVTKLNLCLMSFIIGFGGLSVVFQVYSIIAKENISIRPYIYGKFLQGVFSFFITMVLFS